MPESPILIGWHERVHFPDWGLRRVRAKVDTGARTSALHVDAYRLVEDPARGPVVDMQLSLPGRRRTRHVNVQAIVARMATVRNSGGVAEERPVVVATVQLGPITQQIELTITNRAIMRFPMLLGRLALKGKFIVDVSRGNLLV